MPSKSRRTEESDLRASRLPSGGKQPAVKGLSVLFDDALYLTVQVVLGDLATEGN